MADYEATELFVLDYFLHRLLECQLQKDENRIFYEQTVEGLMHRFKRVYGKVPGDGILLTKIELCKLYGMCFCIVVDECSASQEQYCCREHVAYGALHASEHAYRSTILRSSYHEFDACVASIACNVRDSDSSTLEMLKGLPVELSKTFLNIVGRDELNDTLLETIAYYRKLKTFNESVDDIRCMIKRQFETLKLPLLHRFSQKEQEAARMAVENILKTPTTEGKAVKWNSQDEKSVLRKRKAE